MKRSLYAAVVAFALLPQAANGGGASGGEWESLGNDDGVAVFRREVPGSPVIAFKGEGLIDVPILTVGSVIIDPTRATEWVDSLVEARTVRKIGETEYIEYDHV